MARSLSNAKVLCAVVRGYATASQGAVSGSGRAVARSGMTLKKGGEEATKNTPWVPDPVTGYYRPENQPKELDAAELRELLMARSFSSVKAVAALVRGYATASQGVASGSGRVGARSGMMLKKGGEEAPKNSPWVPDPVTGYYRPENQAKELDAAELRELLLKHKN
ncbi:hypothetical protein RJ640_019933 [Escallonia rubra]|uniref:Late embryogenesis abundant protein n=1 Tax=Escallonia rubra TaxID=112253 RepID=A0AA88Q9Q5_9ASTE|nr:hypothetical protein RJ640_019933 [Escallonia rubra]